jgi:hypothetical protein
MLISYDDKIILSRAARIFLAAPGEKMPDMGKLFGRPK